LDPTSVCLVSAAHTRSGSRRRFGGHDARWDPVMRQPMRSDVDTLGDGDADQIDVKVGDVDWIDEEEEDLRSDNGE
jgi:hypothetical protein